MWSLERNVYTCLLYTSDLPDKEFYDTEANSVGIFRFGNRQAFVGEEVTLLQPECLWYPQSVAPIHLSSLFDRQVDFTPVSYTHLMVGAIIR